MFKGFCGWVRAQTVSAVSRLHYSHGPVFFHQPKSSQYSIMCNQAWLLDWETVIQLWPMLHECIYDRLEAAGWISVSVSVSRDSRWPRSGQWCLPLFLISVRRLITWTRLPIRGKLLLDWGVMGTHAQYFSFLSTKKNPPKTWTETQFLLQWWEQNSQSQIPT